MIFAAGVLFYSLCVFLFKRGIKETKFLNCGIIAKYTKIVDFSRYLGVFITIIDYDKFVIVDHVYPHVAR